MEAIKWYLIAVVIFVVITLNTIVSSTVYRFKYPKKTETEILMNIGNIFMWNFKDK